MVWISGITNRHVIASPAHQNGIEKAANIQLPLLAPLVQNAMNENQNARKPKGARVRAVTRKGGIVKDSVSGLMTNWIRVSNGRGATSTGRPTRKMDIDQLGSDCLVDPEFSRCFEEIFLAVGSWTAAVLQGG